MVQRRMSAYVKSGWGTFFASLGVIACAACSSTNHTPVPDGGGTMTTCGSGATVEDQGEQDCKGCTSTGACTTGAPLEACCNWNAAPNAALARSTNLHRYSAMPGDSPAPDLSCLTSPGTLGTPQMVTLTGYVWLFSSGQDSAGVKVEVFKETKPNTDGAIDASPLGSYTTSSSDPTYPIAQTTWDTHGCPSPGCSYRQYTIANVPTETPLVIKTSDAMGGSTWATVYDYNIFFANGQAGAGDGGAPTVHYDATAAAAGDPGTVAGTVGLTIQGGQGVLAGEVHDCASDNGGLGVRLSGATVGTSVQPQGGVLYFTTDEANPLPDQTAVVTSDLGLFAGVNLPTGKPIRITAVGQDPAASGKFEMIGTYVVQVYPGAVTAIALRGRRPWQL